MHSTTASAEMKVGQRLPARLMLVTVGMFGFGYLLVPLYDALCELTGLNGKTASEAAIAAPARIDDARWVDVEFVTTVNRRLSWDFRAVTTKRRVHPGEQSTVDFVAVNLADEAIIGQAVPSVSPGSAARYFKKSECFCFSEQRLEARDSRTMPVRFYIDPALPKDIGTVTLSYTFFQKLEAKM
jgi:cytochrome c oxidase assembly protein subunit 11